jgi:putative DNA primase/helicase
MRIPERQAELDALTRKYLTDPDPEPNGHSYYQAAGPPPDLADDEVLEFCRKAKNAAKFLDLYEAGDTSLYGGDESRADLALMSMLAFYTQDPTQLEGLFDDSALGLRPKWKNRPDYRRRTIDKALKDLRETYTPRRHKQPSTNPAGGSAPPGPNGHGGGHPPERFNLTDLGNAERFVARHGRDVRYCYPWAKWLVWTGARWERDEAGKVHRLAKETVRSIYGEAAAAEDEDRRKALAQHATRSEAESKIRAMLELAKSEVPVSPDELDADPWLLNAPNGTVDLRTGELRAHRREDLLTKMVGTDYDPEAPAAAWGAFLERVLPGEDLRTYVQRSVGNSATGDTSEQVMFINHGVGANGKSTFQEVVSATLGDYAMRTPTETLLAKRVGGVPNDVARLKGARFVAASETEEGRRLAESLVKDLTGQDTISARYMRAEWFDFKPTHKLWLSTNHKPEIRGTDNAIWRRIRLIPWSVTIPPAQRDHKLSEKLCAELPGILAWIVQGCLAWRREGLRAPNEVRQATREYKAEMDLLAGFLDDCCVVHRNAEVGATDLYNAYKGWAETSGERVETQRKFGTRLAERGFAKEKIGGLVRWFGIGLPSNGPEPGPSRSNDSSGETSSFAGKRSSETGPLGPSGPKNTINPKKNSPRGVMRKKGLEGPNGPERAGEDLADEEGNNSKPNESLHRPRRLTEEEAQRVQKLISDGMKPDLARAEVLGGKQN